MDQPVVTIAIAIMLIVVLVASYIRSRNDEGNGEEDPQTSVSETMREAKEYFGIRSGKDNEGGLSHTLDLGAVEFLSGVSSKRHSSRSRSKRH